MPVRPSRTSQLSLKQHTFLDSQSWNSSLFTIFVCQCFHTSSLHQYFQIVYWSREQSTPWVSTIALTIDNYWLIPGKFNRYKPNLALTKRHANLKFTSPKKPRLWQAAKTDNQADIHQASLSRTSFLVHGTLTYSTRSIWFNKFICVPSNSNKKRNVFISLPKSGSHPLSSLVISCNAAWNVVITKAFHCFCFQSRRNFPSLFSVDSTLTFPSSLPGN